MSIGMRLWRERPGSLFGFPGRSAICAGYSQLSLNGVKVFDQSVVLFRESVVLSDHRVAIGQKALDGLIGLRQALVAGGDRFGPGGEIGLKLVALSAELGVVALQGADAGAGFFCESRRFGELLSEDAKIAIQSLNGFALLGSLGSEITILLFESDPGKVHPAICLPLRNAQDAKKGDADQV